MLEITSIKNGIVIDHIEAGLGIKIFNYLELDKSDYSVALIINTTLALLSPKITICEVKNEQIVRKVKPSLPNKVHNIIKCKNPSCITKVEEYVPHSFILVDEENGRYRCEYCDVITKLSEN